MLATSWTFCHTQQKYVNSCSVKHLYQSYCMRRNTGSCRLGMSFRWGTDVPHLHTMHLQTRASRPTQPTPWRARTGTQRNVTSTAQNVTLDGRVICKLFNARVGCHYKRVQNCSSMFTFRLPPVSFSTDTQSFKKTKGR